MIGRTSFFMRASAAVLVSVLIGACHRQDQAASAQPETSEHWVLISNDEKVGRLDAVRRGNTVHIDYAVDNNGRGPKIKETLRLDTQGYPLDWSITGSSLFGAAVDENYTYKDGQTSWSSQADNGSKPLAAPALYIGADDSPWSLVMYARALLKAPAHTLDVLPSGRLKLEQVAIQAIGADQTPVTVYSLSGINLQPTFIALDQSGRLFARLGDSGALIRAGFEAAVPELNELSRKLELDRLRRLQAELAHRFDQPVRIDNVRVFDPSTRQIGPPVSVLVRDGLIAAIEPPLGGAADPMDVVIDGEGGTLVAGLTDMHSHSSLESGLNYLAAGVTSTRDMGNDNQLLPRIMQSIEDGELAGPRITPDGLIEARSPYSARIGIVADTLDEALAAVDWYADRGYFEIKLYNSIKPDWLAPLIAEARKRGMGVTGHVPAFVTPEQAIEAGYDAIAHINQLMLGWLLEPGEDTRTPLRLTAMKRAANLDLDSERVQHTVDLMVQHGTALGTTAVILERLMLSRAGEVNPGDAPYLDHVPIGYQRYRKRTFVPLKEPGDDAAYREAFERLLQVIKLLHDRGVPLLIGTDDTTGFTVHRELELYVKAGISPGETLEMATLGCAHYLGVEDRLGSIEPGKLADFFLIPDDPTEDIGAVRRIRMVSRGGVIYYPAEIYRALDIEPFASNPPIHLPESHMSAGGDQ